MIQRKPLGKPVRAVRSLAEIQNPDSPSGPKVGMGAGKGQFPIRDHRQPIREQNNVGLPAGDCLLPVFHINQTDIAPSVSPNALGCFSQHRRRTIDANQLAAVLQGALNGGEVGARTATDFNDPFTRPDIELFDDPAPAVKKDPTSRVVKLRLRSVVIRHRVAMTGSSAQILRSHVVTVAKCSEAYVPTRSRECSSFVRSDWNCSWRR